MKGLCDNMLSSVYLREKKKAASHTAVGHSTKKKKSSSKAQYGTCFVLVRLQNDKIP